MDIKAALAEARRNQEAQFAKDWLDRLKQLKAEEVILQLLYWLYTYSLAHYLHTAYIGSQYNSHHEVYPRVGIRRQVVQVGPTCTLICMLSTCL